MAKKKYTDTEVLSRARQIVLDIGLVDAPATDKLFNRKVLSHLNGDGSTRRFWRLDRSFLDSSLEGLIIAAPATTSTSELAESESAWRIGKHLRNSGVKVPEIYGWDKESGVLVFEDLGDVRLQDVVLNALESGESRNDEITAIYKKVLSGLITMQVNGSTGFNGEWCWDTPSYDSSLMISRESEYFLKAFWQLLLDQPVHEGVSEEFRALAERVEKASSAFFLHRDFQSRNIMIKDGVPWFIDFQGGRRGPLGYDLASLLIDPYCGLAPDLQDELFDIYYNLLQSEMYIPSKVFRVQYNYLFLQRNMQIIGAFSFLYKVRHKEFFRSFILPSLLSLKLILELQQFDDFPILRSMAETGFQRVNTMGDLL